MIVDSKPKLRFPEFSSEWVATKLGEYIEEIAMGPFGSNLKVDMFTNSGVPIIKGGNLLGPKVSGPYSFVSEEKADSLGKSIAKPGDFVLTHRGTLGQIAVVPKNTYPRYVTSQSQLRFKVDECELNNQWLGQYFKTTLGKQRMLIDAGQVGVPAISFPTLSVKKILLVKPSLSEQQKIAEFLAVVDDKIDAIDKKVELLKKYKKAVLQKILTQQIRFKDENGNSFPEWEEKKLEEISRYSDTRISASKLAPVNYVGVENLLQSGGKSASNFVPKTSNVSGYQKGDTLLSNIRPYLKKFWYANETGGASPDVLVVRPDFTKASSDYLYLHLTSDAFFVYAMSGAKGVKMPRGDKNQIMKYKIDLPSMEEQQKIADFLTTIDDKIKAEEAKLTAAKTFKKSLLQRMFV